MAQSDIQTPVPAPPIPVDSPEPVITTDDRSLGDLFSQMTSDLSTLMRKEVELAKVEAREEIAEVSKSGAFLGAGAFIALLALLLLSFAAAWGLAAVLPEGVAFLIVGAVYAIVAAVLIMVGRKRMKSVDLVPKQTVETVKEDVQWAKEQMS